MKIIQTTKNKVKFADLVGGDVFHLDGIFFLKLAVATSAGNSVKLETGGGAHLNGTAWVTLLPNAGLLLDAGEEA
jgi:hypothetical protein